MTGPSPCGTVAGYSRHQRAGNPPCDACRTARAAYDGRRSTAPTDDPAHWRAVAKGRALDDLRRRHPDEYAELYRHHQAQVLPEEPIGVEPAQ